MENIGAEGAKSSIKKEEKDKKSMTAQSRLILIGLVVSTLFILAVAFFAISSIDKNMNHFSLHNLRASIARPPPTMTQDVRLLYQSPLFFSHVVSCGREKRGCLWRLGGKVVERQ